MEKDNNIIKEDNQQEKVLFQDACIIIDQAQATAYRQVNETLIKRNWLLGMRIQHEALKDKRAEYGEQVVKFLAKELTAKSENIFHALRAKSPIRLSWTHYRIILQENSKEAREWYEQEAAREMWGTV